MRGGEGGDPTCSPAMCRPLELFEPVLPFIVSLSTSICRLHVQAVMCWHAGLQEMTRSADVTACVCDWGPDLSKI